MRWEYRIVECNYGQAQEEACLKALGDDGWELVAVHPWVVGRWLYLKRPKP